MIRIHRCLEHAVGDLLGARLGSNNRLSLGQQVEPRAPTRSGTSYAIGDENRKQSRHRWVFEDARAGVPVDSDSSRRFLNQRKLAILAQEHGDFAVPSNQDRSTGKVNGEYIYRRGNLASTEREEKIVNRPRGSSIAHALVHEPGSVTGQSQAERFCRRAAPLAIDDYRREAAAWALHQLNAIPTFTTSGLMCLGDGEIDGERHQCVLRSRAIDSQGRSSAIIPAIVGGKGISLERLPPVPALPVPLDSLAEPLGESGGRFPAERLELAGV